MRKLQVKLTSYNFELRNSKIVLNIVTSISKCKPNNKKYIFFQDLPWWIASFMFTFELSTVNCIGMTKNHKLQTKIISVELSFLDLEEYFIL